MVKQTHQDCLSQFHDGLCNHEVRSCFMAGDVLADIGGLDRPKELFDLDGNYRRKVSLSWLDENIDDSNDWSSFVTLANDVDCLLLVDDRPKNTNPILRAYDCYTKQRYVKALRHAGIAAEIVKPLNE